MILALAALVAWPAPAALAQNEPNLAGYRERFKEGFDRYEAGDVAGALSFWEPLYRDLGPVRGYRIGYNLARAYEVVGDATRAAERYESFLAELATKQKAGEAVGATVTHDAAQAQARLDDLAKTRGRIRVASTTPPVSVRIDEAEPRLSGFMAYVAPGPHDVVFAPGAPDEHRARVEVAAGEVIDAAPPAAAPPAIVAAAPPHASSSIRLATPRAPRGWEEVVVHPFSPAWLWVAGAVTLASGGLTGAAYGSWALPAAFAIGTACLVAWYVFGKRHVHVPIGAGPALVNGGGGSVWSF